MNKSTLKIIIGVIIVAILAIPVFLILNQTNNETKYDDLLNDIEEAATKWAKINMNDIDETVVKLGDLKQVGFMPYNLINPKNNKHLSNETYVVITKNADNTYRLEVKLYEIPDKETNGDYIVQINGDKNAQTGISSYYQELGIIIYEGKKNIPYSVQYFYKNKEIRDIDTSRPKNYEAIYTALNNKNEIIKVTRKVVVQ